MTIPAIQTNTNTEQINLRRKNHRGIKTAENVKPLPPQGHLVHDTIFSAPKFWIKDFAYDMKAVKDGFAGKTNDHQQGRLNDVGLAMGGIGIASYLASRTNDPKLKMMEFVGLASFLAAMAIYPKIAINLPSRIVHGFDIGKEYIDDQGRKKSVFQDSNYIPFDMYKGEYKGEDLDIIGDRLGIPRDIKNRHDLIKEQMRKIATQNNTLWMLTAGFATPVLAALMCVGAEKLIVPAMNSIKNSDTDKKIAELLQESKETNMKLKPEEVKPNELSKKASEILGKYKNKILPQQELDNLLTLITDKTEANVEEAIREDLTKLLHSNIKYNADANSITEAIKKTVPTRNQINLSEIFTLTTEEIENVIRTISPNSNNLSQEEIRALRAEFKKVFENKYREKGATFNKQFFDSVCLKVNNKISSTLLKRHIHIIDETQISQAVNFAKIIGDFKSKEILADKCISAKFEEAPQTVLAQYYEKFENTLLDVLNIKLKDLKAMKESPLIAEEILKTKVEELVKDNIKYKNAITKLSDIMSKMEIALHGETSGSKILDLITATENIYNNTAKRLNNIDGTAFMHTIDQLVKEDVSSLKPTLIDRDSTFKLLDGRFGSTINAAPGTLEYARQSSNGVGSAKRLAISRIIERYQGVKNSFNRILLALDAFKHELPADPYLKEVAQRGRNALISGNTSQFIQKLKLDNNSTLYRDIMRTTFNENNLDRNTTDSIKSNSLRTGDVLHRLKEYIKRFRIVLGSDQTDYKKPLHVLGDNPYATYSEAELTSKSIFNLTAQNPRDMVQKAASRKYGNLVWLKKASIIGGAVLGITILTQFAFGRIKNPHNIQKQVNDDTNN